MTMASAYSAFANEGVKYDAHFIRRIVDASGKTIVDEDADSTRVVSEKVANEMTSMMIDVYKNGTGLLQNRTAIRLQEKPVRLRKRS